MQQACEGGVEGACHIRAPPPQTLARWETLDYYTFDALAAAVDIGHELGLEVHGWMTLNEDDHGLGWLSRFTREHLECRWVCRNGERYRSQVSPGPRCWPRATAALTMGPRWAQAST
ncbi:MAG: hypothetical protein AB1505_11115 [Candidatus Latescibacterota bacterium]